MWGPLHPGKHQTDDTCKVSVHNISEATIAISLLRIKTKGNCTIQLVLLCYNWSPKIGPLGPFTAAVAGPSASFAALQPDPQLYTVRLDHLRHCIWSGWTTWGMHRQYMVWQSSLGQTAFSVFIHHHAQKKWYGWARLPFSMALMITKFEIHNHVRITNILDHVNLELIVVRFTEIDM